LNEWVRSHCRDFTRPQRPSFVAFTMRACSLLTLRSCSDQRSRSQRDAMSKDAHPDFSTFICDFLLGWFCVLFRDELPAGSGLAFATEHGDSYPPDYRAAFAF